MFFPMKTISRNAKLYVHIYTHNSSSSSTQLLPPLMPPIGPDGGTGPRGSMAKISGVPYVTSSFSFRLTPTPVAIVSFGPTRELSFGTPTVRPRVAVDRGIERQKKRRRETNRIAVVLAAMAERKKHKSWEMDRRTASVVSSKGNAEG